jgi:hypothetical protein
VAGASQYARDCLIDKYSNISYNIGIVNTKTEKIMTKFEVRFDCGNDDRSPAWTVVRFENLGSDNARFGQTVAEFASRELAENAARTMNQHISFAKFTFSPSLVAE